MHPIEICILRSRRIMKVNLLSPMGTSMLHVEQDY